MLLSLFLTSSSVLAGGSAQSSDTGITNIRKRQNIDKGYIAIAAKVEDTQYCLRYYGAMIAGISTCGNLNHDNPLSLFRYKRAFPNVKSGSDQHKYLLVSAFDDKLCLDLNSNTDLGYLRMVQCSTNPWVFNWNSTARSLDQPDSKGIPLKFKVISSPRKEFKDTFAKSKCYTPNRSGGLALENCENTQQFTWFIYPVTIDADKFKSHSVNSKGSTKDFCDNLSNNVEDNEYACESLPEDFTIIRGIHNNGVLAKNTKSIAGIGLASSFRFYFKLTANSFDSTKQGDSNILKMTSGNRKFEVSLLGNKLHVEGLGFDVIHDHKLTADRRYNVKLFVIRTGSKYYLKIYTFCGDDKKEVTYRPDQIDLKYDDVKYNFASPAGNQIADASLNQISINYLADNIPEGKLDDY